MSKPETVRPALRGTVVHARSASVPSELPATLLSPLRYPRPQHMSQRTSSSKSTGKEPDEFINGEKHLPVVTYSPQLGPNFALSRVAASCPMRASRGLTPPTSAACNKPISKMFLAAKHSSCTNSPVANHKALTENYNRTAATEQNSPGPDIFRLFWHRPRSGEPEMIVNQVSVEQNMANTTGFVTTTVKTTTTPSTNKQNPQPSSPFSDKPITTTLTSTNTTTSCASTHTLGRSTFFQRLRWRRGQRGTRSASNSADGSPILTTSELPTHLSNTTASLDTDFGQVPDVATTSTACVKLVDTQITKGPNGFGLTLADVVTFIPDKLLGLRSTSGCSSHRLGFYQRLLQIRSVNSSSLPGSPHDRETGKSGSTNHSVRPGDMLLAVEGFRLAGCTPEFAVRLLASVPVGGVVHVTLLRGLALAPMSTRSKQEQFLTDRLNSKYASQETTNNYGHSVGCKSETVSPLLCDGTLDSLKKSERKVPFKCESAKWNEKLFDIDICKQSGGFGFTLVKVDGKFLVDTVASNITYSDHSGQVEKTLLPGDQVLEMGHLHLESLAQPQVMQLMESYPVGKSLRFLVSRDYEKCVTPVLGLISLDGTNALVQAATISDSQCDQFGPGGTPVTGGPLQTVESYTLMPFQWICGLSTNSGAVKSSSKTSTGFKGSEKYDTPQFQPNLPDAVAGLMPFRCPLQGVGISGPCKTPDYVPASHFLASTSHVTNSPLTEIPSLIVNPWLSDQPAQPASSVASVPVTLSPHVSPIVSSKFGLDHPANPSPSKSAVETKVGPPVNGMSSCFPLSEGPIKDNILPVTSVNHETLSALSNCIAAGDLLVAVDGQSVAGLNHDGVMQLMQLGSLSNSTDHSVRLTFRRTRKQQQDEPPDSPCPTSVPEDGNSKQPGNFRFRSFVPSKPNTFGGSSNASVQPGQNIPIIDVARMDSALPKDSTGEVTEDLSDAFNVNLRREENEGFGFVIVSSLNTNKASEIGRIIPGSPAERCGKLTVGNRIVAINGQMLSGLHHTEIVQLIRQSQQHLILTVKRPRNSNDEPLEWKTGTEHRYSACHENFDKSTIEANCVRQDERQTNKIDNNFAQVEITPVQSEYTVTLRRGPHGFGFSIRGGMDFERIPLFVFRIAEGGPAHLDGRMQVGDEIVLINGTPTHLLTHKQAVDTIRQSGENLSLLLSRLSNRLCETGV